jgi:hypothetical protein
MARCNLLGFTFGLVFTCTALAADFSVEKSEEGITVKVDGKLMTRYLVKSGAKPILWPLVGPTGQEVTRGYPMRPATPNERADHPHQRSFWFTHGMVNNVDFWSEGKNHGDIVHRAFLKVEGGPRAVIETVNDWLAPGGQKVCEDQRTFTFGATNDARWIDVDLLVKATNGEVVFGDTKEGSFGLRVAGTMDVTAKKGGRIVNSEGKTDAAAWGQPAAWVDYQGHVAGETVGIAIVRDYGLFAANPFGLHDFLNSKEVDGSHKIAAGGTMSLRYRILLHRGDEKQGRVAEVFAEYSKSK